MQISLTRDRKITTIWFTSLIGLIVSGYLTFVKLFHQPIYCTPGLGDCESVNASRWSELWGVPIALFGMLSYLAVLILVLLGPKIRLIKTYNNHLVFGIGTFGFLFSLYLTYLELFVIKAICQWCLVSALCMTIIFIFSIFNLRKSQSQQIAKRRR